MDRTERVFDALENPEDWDECPECNGYGSSLEQASDYCHNCDGTGVVPADD